MLPSLVKNNEQVFKDNQDCGAQNEPILPLFLYDFAYLLGSISSANFDFQGLQACLTREKWLS